jgi:hypothetical protein
MKTTLFPFLLFQCVSFWSRLYACVSHSDESLLWFCWRSFIKLRIFFFTGPGFGKFVDDVFSGQSAIVTYFTRIGIIWKTVKHWIQTKQTNSVAFSPQANSTDWETATCQRNLVPTFADRGVSRGQSGGSPTAVNLSSLDRSRYFSFKYLLIYPHEAEWTPFQTHCYSENLATPGIESGTSVSAARNSDH